MSDELKPKFQFTGDPGSTLLYFGDEFVAHVRGKFRVELQKLLNTEQQQAARIAELESELATLRPLAELAPELAYALTQLFADWSILPSGNSKDDEDICAAAQEALAKFRALQPEKPE